MTTYHFTGPKIPVKRKGTCPDCGKKVTRSHTIEKTVNPFNCKVVDGQRIPKTWDEVLADCRAEADAWQPQSWRCQNCEFTAWVVAASPEALRGHISMERWDADNFRRSGKERRAELCEERIAAYEARLAEIGGAL